MNVAPPRKNSVARFYDEAGVRHIHDLTIYATVYACSRNHAYRQETLSRCPARGCAWNKQPMVRTGEQPIGAKPIEG
jgi:hypothetical protein